MDANDAIIIIISLNKEICQILRLGLLYRNRFHFHVGLLGDRILRLLVASGFLLQNTHVLQLKIRLRVTQSLCVKKVHDMLLFLSDNSRFLLSNDLF